MVNQRGTWNTAKKASEEILSGPYGVGHKLFRLVIFLVAVSAQSLYAIEQTVTLTTEPDGATVCEKKGRDLNCSWNTPASFVADFRSDISSKRYYLRKLGYDPATVMVRYANPGGNFKLNKQEILSPPSEHKNAELRLLQSQINPAIESLIYGNQLGLPGYVFVGRINPLEIAGKNYVKVEILLDDDFRKGPYRTLSRLQNDDERLWKIAEEILKTDAGKLMVALGGTLREISGIDGIMLVTRYSKQQLVPVDDDATFTHVYRQYRGQTRSGDYVYDNYTIITRTLTTGYLKLEQQSEINTLLLYVSLPDIPAQFVADTTARTLLDNSIIFSNENRQKEMVEVRNYDGN